MAIYRSGRTRRIEVTGNWAAIATAQYVCSGTFPVEPNRFFAVSEGWVESIEARALGAKIAYWPISSFGSWPADPGCSIVLNAQYDTRLSLTFFEGTPFEVTTVLNRSDPYQVGSGTELFLDLATSYRISAEVEEFFEVIDPIEESDADGFPEFSGIARAESVTGRRIRFFERLKVGETMSLQVTGMFSGVESLVVSQAMSDELGDIWHGVDRRGKVVAKGRLASLGISASFAGVTPSSNYSAENASGIFDAINTFFLTLSKSAGQYGTSYGFVAAALPTQLDFKFKRGVGSNLLTDPVVARVQHGSTPAVLDVLVEGEAEESVVHRQWSAFATLDGQSMPPGGVDEPGEIRAWLTPESLAATGDDPGDRRLQIRGKQWLAATIQHLPEVVIDAGESLTGWSSTGVLSQDSGAIRVEFAQASGSLTRTFSPALNSEAMRKLRIKLRSRDTSDSALTLTIADKEWEIKTGGLDEWVSREVDLCLPKNLVEEVDEKESRFPLLATGKVKDSAHWGVSEMETLSLGGFPVGRFEIDEIALVRHSIPKLSILPAAGPWRVRQAGQPTLIKTLLWSEVDGRICDLPGMTRTGNVTSWPSVTQVLGELGTKLGWSVTMGPPGPDDYHSMDREAELLGGGGVLRDLESLKFQVDLAFADPKELSIQALWDEVEVYPQAGDVFGSPYGGPTVLCWGKLHRAQAWGLLAKGNQSVAAGASVTLESPSGLAGSDTSDSLGRYLTELPGGKPGALHTVKARGRESSEFALFNRARHRRVMHEVVTKGGLSMDVHPAGLAVMATRSNQNQVRLGVKGNQVGLGYRTIETDFTAASLCVRWDRGRRQRIWLVTEELATIKERFSDDFGATWSMATTLASGNVRFPAFVIHPDGTRWTYWLVDGQVNGILRDQSGQILRSFSGVRTGVDESGLALAILERPGGILDFELVTVEDSELVSSFSRDGQNFA